MHWPVQECHWESREAEKNFILLEQTLKIFTSPSTVRRLPLLGKDAHFVLSKYGLLPSWGLWAVSYGLWGRFSMDRTDFLLLEQIWALTGNQKVPGGSSRCHDMLNQH